MKAFLFSDDGDVVEAAAPMDVPPENLKVKEEASPKSKNAGVTTIPEAKSPGASTSSVEISAEVPSTAAASEDAVARSSGRSIEARSIEVEFRMRASNSKSY